MPGGRNRPPHDSIDSILLAICRRENIDPDTLSHYFDRLEEEWTEGVRDKVLHLLRTHDATAHAAAVLILSELATDTDLEELEDLVADPTVSDMAKLTIAPVLKELDSEMADDGLIDYLNDPEAAMQQMQVRLLELVGQSELGVESILDDMLSMPLERRLSFVQWLGSSHDIRAARLLIPLLENQSSKVIFAAIDALEQLGAIAAQQSIPALNYLISHTANRQLKQHARTALGRLTMQSAPGTEDSAMTEARQPLLRFYEARVSFLDGTGAQMIMLSWMRPDGLLKGVNVLYQDSWGIKDCYGTDEMEVEHWTKLVADMEGQGFGSFQVPLAYSRTLIAEAYALSKRTRRKLPVAYAIWRPLIEHEKAGNDANADTSTQLAPCELNSETLALVQHGNELYDLSEFVSWLFDPLDRIQPYIDRYWKQQQRYIVEQLNAGPKGRNRKNAARISQNRIELETVIDEAITDLIDEKWRSLYEGRLRRQGKLFQFVERQEDEQLVCAVAAALQPTSSVPATEQPFLRTMMRLTIEQGPLRAIAEALSADNFGSMPINLFPDM